MPAKCKLLVESLPSASNYKAIKMKNKKLFLLIVIILSSCTTVTLSPTQTSTPEPTSPISTVDVNGAASTPVKMDPAKGGIQGNISWLDPVTSTKIPVKTVNLELNGHSGSKPPRYTIKTDPDGNYKFVNIEPINYGFGVYFSIPLSERLCDNPEITYDQDFGWLHYTTWLKGELWFDIIFSSKDVVVKPGEVVILDFALKCP